MAEIHELKLLVTVDKDTGQLKVVNSELKQTQEQLNDATNATNNLSDAQNLLSKALPLASIGALTLALQDLVRTAEEENEAIRRLNFALESNGISWAQNQEAINAWTNSLQNATRFSDTEAYEALGRMMRATNDLTQAQMAVKLAMDMSVASGKSLQETQEIIALALSGNERALIMLRRSFGSFVADAKNTEEALELLRQRVDGASAAEDSYTKTTRQATNAIDDIKERLGNLLIPAFSQLSKIISETLKTFEPFLTGITAVISTFIAGLSTSIGMVGSLLRVLRGDFQGAIEGIEKTTREGNEKIKQIWTDTAEKLIELEKTTTKNKKEQIDERVKLKVKETEKAKEEIEKQRQKEIEELEKAYDDYDEVLEEKKKLAEDYQNFLISLEQSETARNLLKLEQDYQKKIEQNLLFLTADQNYVDQSKAIDDWYATEKQKILDSEVKAKEEAVKKKYNLEKITSSGIDILLAGSAEKQKELIWQLVAQEAEAAAKKTALAAAVALATGNFAQAGIAASQTAIALGVASFARGEKEKLQKEAETRRIREEEQIREMERQRLESEKLASEKQEIEENRIKYEYEQGKISTDNYVAFLKKKQSAYKEYSKEWLSIQREIENAEEGRTQAIQEQYKEASKLRGEIKGASVKTEQKEIHNTYNINLNVSAMDLRTIEERQIRDIATRLLPYLKQQERR